MTSIWIMSDFRSGAYKAREDHTCLHKLFFFFQVAYTSSNIYTYICICIRMFVIEKLLQVLKEKLANNGFPQELLFLRIKEGDSQMRT